MVELVHSPVMALELSLEDYFEQTGATEMSFAMHINMERCTGCNNCVVACPVNALELCTVDPVSTDKIYKVFDGKATCLDVNHALCAGCGVCVEVCPYEVVSLVAPTGAAAEVAAEEH